MHGELDARAMAAVVCSEKIGSIISRGSLSLIVVVVSGLCGA